uniref:Ubiquitin-like domain-containing protein n=1 Tax=Kalanchoe fedtschenkoi TaxID=63787 RepID=A0A7N0TIQ9_KALFE
MASPSTQPPLKKRQLPDDLPRLVSIRITGPGDKVVKANIKGSVPLMKLLKMYFKELSLDPQSVEALYDGHRLAPNRTPDELGMADEDEIQVVSRADGGSNCRRVCF